jgi:hypothetical protein
VVLIGWLFGWTFRVAQASELSREKSSCSHKIEFCSTCKQFGIFRNRLSAVQMGMPARERRTLDGRLAI